MAIQTISTTNNPITGVFGTGQVQFFTATGVWTVPPGIGKVRARMWGGGGGNDGGGGGFALKTIYDLSGVTSVAVIVGAGPTSTITGGTSSFGSYVSATGGSASGTSATVTAGGTGIGGDINNTGGTGGAAVGGGGSASVFGNGGAGATVTTNVGRNSTGGAGGAGGGTTTGLGGNGFFGIAGNGSSILGVLNMPAFSIDFIGTGFGGGTGLFSGMNGGGGSTSAGAGGFPGGGGGNTLGAGGGLVIVEW